MKICYYDAGHINKVAAMPIYRKTLQNVLLRNQWTDYHEIWYVFSGTPAHNVLFK